MTVATAGVIRRGARVGELSQRIRKLTRQAERGDLGRVLPVTVPRLVFLMIVPVHRVVPLHACRVHREFEAGAAVVVGVDHDLYFVTADAGVAAGEGRPCSVWVGDRYNDQNL